MTLVDAKVLLYAVNSASPQHRAAKTWLRFSGVKMSTPEAAVYRDR